MDSVVIEAVKNSGRWYPAIYEEKKVRLTKKLPLNFISKANE